jgi:hypothetical protein
MDIVLTWPKGRTYESYKRQLSLADHKGEQILFRVSQLPVKAEAGDRVYMVHNGLVRGWSKLLLFDTGQTQPRDPISGDLMPVGNYIVRSAKWHELPGPLPKMKGFQGFRYAHKDWRGLG